MQFNAHRSRVAFRGRTQHCFEEEPAFYQLLYTESCFVMRDYLMPSNFLTRISPLQARLLVASPETFAGRWNLWSPHLVIS